jgi:crossover junction endodeoxyribonuclease RuvC
MTTSRGFRPTSISARTSSPSFSSAEPIRILGIDPGSRATGFGLLLLDGARVHYERSGVIAPRATLPFSDRLLAVYDGLLAILDEMRPDEVAVESAFVRKSPLAALQIGHVRGVILLAARQRGAAIHEYTAPEVKLAVVRQGAAAKEQVAFMVRRLLPQAGSIREDEADALAVALCHAHRAPMRRAAAR